MYRIVTTVNNTALYTKNLLIVDPKYYPLSLSLSHTHTHTHTHTNTQKNTLKDNYVMISLD
jgi:site-specific DNA-adenine methylase